MVFGAGSLTALHNQSTSEVPIIGTIFYGFSCYSCKCVHPYRQVYQPSTPYMIIRTCTAVHVKSVSTIIYSRSTSMSSSAARYLGTAVLLIVVVHGSLHGSLQLRSAYSCTY